jgi:hypothetical protein
MSMHGIIYPTLDLFLYDLRNGLGDSQEEIHQNRAYFQKKLPETIHPFLFQSDTYFDDEYSELLTKPNIKGFESQGEPYLFQGYYYPVRLSDAYGLLIDCSVNNQFQAQPTECFKDLKIEIEQRLNRQTGKIGQTWMISGWLPEERADSPEEIAKACYKALMPDSDWEQDLEGQGRFLEATIFELSRYRLVMQEKTTSPETIENIQQNNHVIIIIYPNKEVAEQAARFYSEWLRLFCYRHKILWAYGQSRFLKQTIRNYFSAVEEDRQSINPNQTKYREFERFSKTLTRVQDTLNNYTIDLNKLTFQSGTIDINLGNYKKRLERIEKKSQSNLKFLEDFAKLVEDKYQHQITKDSENLERGLKLLEDTTNAVRSRLEVAKAEHDRNFQDTVTVIVVGWSVGSFVKSLNKLGEDNKDPLRVLLDKSPLIPDPWIQPTTQLTYTLVVAIVAAALAWLARWLWRRSH